MNDSVVRRVRVCDESELAEGEVRAVAIEGGAPVAVARVDGRYYVTDDTCTHAKASLGDGGFLDGHKLICPVHAGEFDIRTGAALCFPLERPLRTYRVAMRDGGVWIDLDLPAEPV